MTTLVSSLALSLALVAAPSAAPSVRPAAPPYMKPPAGWRSLGVPPPNTVDYGWVSPHFRDGTPHAGDSMEAWVSSIPANSTLADQVQELITEETHDGRTVASSRSHATCNGTQPSWRVDLRLPMFQLPTVSQVYQVAVFKGHVYVITFTHRADLQIDAAVEASLDSLCPKNG